MDWPLIERIARFDLEKPTGMATLFINQGGLQNRKIPKADKALFKQMTDQSRNWGGRTFRIICNIAEGKLKSLRTIWP